jgi:hypothetical protein
MTNVDILVEAFRRGRTWDPAYPNLHNLDEAAIRKMTGKEPDAQQLARSLQQSDGNYRTLVHAFHQREPDFDGGIGPATEKLVSIPRCPMPDFAPPKGAAFDFGDADVNAAVQSYQNFAYTGGTGSWPVSGCDPEHKGIHSMRVRIDPTGAPSNWTANRDKILAAVTKSYADMGLSVRYIIDDFEPAELTKTFINLRGGTIGINYFPRGGCSVITGVLSRTYNPSDWRYHAELEGHETGHGVGLEHTNGGRMNPSILLTPDVSTWRGDKSEAALKRYFGGVAIPTDPTDPEPPEPPSGEVEVGRFSDRGNNYRIVRTGGPRPPIEV